MPANTAVHTRIDPVDARPRVPIGLLDAVSWRPRHLLSSFSDRRSLRKIGGMSAYLAQVRWSIWWALRRSNAG